MRSCQMQALRRFGGTEKFISSKKTKQQLVLLKEYTQKEYGDLSVHRELHCTSTKIFFSNEETQKYRDRKGDMTKVILTVLAVGDSEPLDR